MMTLHLLSTPAGHHETLAQMLSILQNGDSVIVMGAAVPGLLDGRLHLLLNGRGLSDVPLYVLADDLELYPEADTDVPALRLDWQGFVDLSCRFPRSLSWS